MNQGQRDQSHKPFWKLRSHIHPGHFLNRVGPSISMLQRSKDSFTPLLISRLLPLMSYRPKKNYHNRNTSTNCLANFNGFSASLYWLEGSNGMTVGTSGSSTTNCLPHSSINFWSNSSSLPSSSHYFIISSTIPINSFLFTLIIGNLLITVPQFLEKISSSLYLLFIFFLLSFYFLFI